MHEFELLTAFRSVIDACIVSYMSGIMKNQIFAYAKTKAQISYAVTAQLISVFVFATWIVQLLSLLNSKFQASSLFL